MSLRQGSHKPSGVGLCFWLAMLGVLAPRLCNAVEVRGRVVDDHGVAVADVQVLAWSVPARDSHKSRADWQRAVTAHRSRPDESYVTTARTDSFGRYSVPGIPPQHYVLEVNLDNDGYSSDFYLREAGLPDRIAPRSAWVDAAGTGETIFARDLLVTRGRRVRVQLTDSESNEPLTFAKPIVVAYRFRHEKDWLRPRARRVIASPSGCFDCRVPRHSGCLIIFAPINTKRIWGGLLVPVEVTIPAEVTDQPVCARVQQAKAWRYVVGD